MNYLDYGEVKIKSKEEYIESRKEERKLQLKQQIEKDYARNFKKKKEKRIAEFRRTKEYLAQVDAKCSNDPFMKEMDNPDFVGSEYSTYFELMTWLAGQQPMEVLEREYAEYAKETREELEKELKTGIVTVTDRSYPDAWRGYYDRMSYGESYEPTIENIDDFCMEYVDALDPCTKEIGDWLSDFDMGNFWKIQDKAIEKLKGMDVSTDLYQLLESEIKKYFDWTSNDFFGEHGLGYDIIEKFDKDYVRECLMQNPHYEWIFKEIKNREEQKSLIGQALLTKIPENFIDLFPGTRKMKRKFVLHVGPTNSGKTHDALEELMSAESGVYLAPLRLLAYECYEKLNSAGVPCRMLTGEEELVVENARHVSSTVEMADLSKHYDVAVIDEAQMIGDEFRGGAWTNAILGLMADTIHVCMAEYAENIVISLIEACGDTYEVVTHKRSVPLEAETESFSFPKSAKKGDALIVFSRRDVFHCAAEAQAAGLKCSVIYGALPYDARRHEVDRFLNGETDIVIATDAIGMGMNLPIRRVIFLKTQKYDGKEERGLLPEEVRQIAGRAGRQGMYEKGLYTSEFGSNKIRKLIEQPVPQIISAVIRFPKSIIGIDGKPSEIISQWMDLPEKPGYKKADSTRELELAKELESRSEDKILIYRFVSMTFDEKNDTVHDVWRQLFDIRCRNADIEDALSGFGVYTYEITDEDGLMSQETQYKKCDLLFQYAKAFGNVEMTKAVMEMKSMISENIKQFLSHKKFATRKCKYCGRALKWNYPYGMCNSCHDAMYPPRYDYWDDNDEFF